MRNAPHCEACGGDCRINQDGKCAMIETWKGTYPPGSETWIEAFHQLKVIEARLEEEETEQLKLQ